MSLRLLPLIAAPLLLLPLAVYAARHRRVRGASWYAVLLLALAIWCAAYAWELAATGAAAKTLALKVKYLGVMTLPVAWLGFVFDFVARERGGLRRVVAAVGVVSAGLLLLAWTDGWHDLFWGGLLLEGTGEDAVLVGRGPGFWINIVLTYSALLVGLAVLVSQAVQSPYLYRKRATLLVTAAVVPWVGNLIFLAGDERPGTVDLTPFLFGCTGVIAALAVFRYGLLDPIPTLGDARIEVIEDGLVILDTGQRVADLNRAAMAIVGRSRAAAAGTDIATLLPGLARLDGQPRRVDIERTMASPPKTFDASVTPIHAPGGRLTGYVVLLRDVTERRRLEDQLRQAQKMEAVGKLAGGIAHDFNNLLTAIIGCATLTVDEVPEGSPARERLVQIQRSAEQAAALTRQLLAFARRQILRPEPLALADVVGHMEPVLRRLVGEDVDVVIRLGDDMPAVVADRTQVQQVLLNLVLNARDAMPGGGRLEIRTEAVEIQGGHRSALAPGLYVAFEVSDTGHGMDAEIVERIFEPFFTTKAFGRGTGLGLATVHGIARQSGGDVEVRSAPGQGSTFRVLLPAVGK